MDVRFFAEADEEVDIAFQWYESQVIGLGYDFLQALDDAVTLIKSFPYGFPEVRKDLKKCLLRRFPY